MISLKEYIINGLPEYIIDNDSYKDIDAKGFVERYLGMLGEELDEEYYPLIEGLLEEYNPLTLTHTEYLDYIAFLLGDVPNLTHDTDSYRRFLTYIVSIYKIKGRKASFSAILYPLQVVMTNLIEIVPTDYKYDAGFNYDDPEVKYDLGCPTCSFYDLELTSLLPLTAELLERIEGAIALVEPINARRRGLTWNGDEVEILHIEVWIDENGDLQYDNSNDPGLILTLLPDGNLHIDGPNANRYFLDEHGDVYFINL